jgi:hypothetical protein
MNMASIISAETNNGQGTAGITYNSRVEVWVADSENGTAMDKADRIASAIEDATDLNSVINMSWGVSSDLQPIRDAINFAHGQGTFLVAAVGNDGNKISAVWPASYDEVVGVSATNENGDLIQQSNWGAPVDLAAPGDDIVVLCSGSDVELQPDICPSSGTSAATALVSGTAALMLTVNDQLQNSDIENFLYQGATTNPGTDRFGNGNLNAYRAVQYAIADNPPAAVVYDPVSLGGETITGEDIIVPANSQLQIAGDVTLENSNLIVWGELTGSGTLILKGNSSLSIRPSGINNFNGDIDRGAEDEQLPKSIENDYTVAKNSTALVDGSQTVVKSGATLTIKSGAELVFDGSGTGLKVEQGAKIAVQGSGSGTVRFKGQDGNQWQNIVVRGDSSVFKNVEIKETGGGCSSSCPALEIAANGVQITNAHIHDNAHAGIGATQTDPYQSSTFTLTNSTLRSNGGEGLKATWSTMMTATRSETTRGPA